MGGTARRHGRLFKAAEHPEDEILATEAVGRVALAGGVRMGPTENRRRMVDEPAAGIPTAQSHVVLDIIETLPKEIAVLLIDHDMDLVFRFAQQITVMVQGSILVEGAPQDIATDKRVREVYLGDSKHGRPAAA